MDTQDRHRFVQQYVERQKAYLPTYTTAHPLNECHGTPSKPLRSDEFGFETPVLRPRVPGNKVAQSQLTAQAGRSKSRTHQPDSSPNQSKVPLGQKDKPRSKRKKASTSMDTDSEHAARLADRQERRRKKRAIINPPQRHDDDIVPTAAPKKGRANGPKAKKSAALALMYGFSATNVTKDRLTLKPAPALGVFGKGRASAKKKATATAKHSSRNESFSESAFLNKPSERVVDRSKIDDDSGDSSVSSISSHPISKVTRAKKDRDKCAKAPAVKTPQASIRTATESELWDIELQSKLPSSVHDVLSEPATKNSAPVVLDLREAEWAASVNVTEEREERRNRARTLGLSVIQSRPRGHSILCSSPLAISDQQDELGIPYVVDAPSIHPSHSASQVGCRTADAQPIDLPLVASKYFNGSKAISVQEFATDPSKASRLNDDIGPLGSKILDPDLEDATLDVQTIHRVASPINSLISVPQPMVGLQSQYDITPLEFSSDVSPYDDRYACVDVPLRGTYGGYLESSVMETQRDRTMSATEHHHSHRSMTREWYPSVDIATGDVEDVSVEDFDGPYDPLAREYEDELGEPRLAVEPCFFETRAEYGPGEEPFSEQWFHMAETGQDSPDCEDEAADRSICDSEESLRDGESGEDVADFLEGRALLNGVTERSLHVGLSGLVQAEMYTASQLRDHWRPVRL